MTRGNAVLTLMLFGEVLKLTNIYILEKVSFIIRSRPLDIRL